MHQTRAWMLCALVVVGGCTPSSGPAPEPANPVVRVLPLEVVGSSVEESRFVGQAVSRSIVAGLGETDGLTLLDVAPAPDADIDAGQEPTHVISGQLTREDRTTRIQLSLREVSTGRELPGVSGSNPDISAAASELAKAVANALGARRIERYDYRIDLAGGAEMSSSPSTARALEAFWSYDLEALEAESDELLEAFPDDPAAHLLAVWSQLYTWERNPTAETLATLRERLDLLVRADPDNPYGNLFRGFVYRTSGELEDAIRLYSRVLARTDITDVTRAWALRQRSVALGKIGRSESALADARQAVDLDPSSASGRVALSRVLEAMARLDEAAGAAREALALRPTWRQYQRLGLVLTRTGKLKEATRVLEQACRLSEGREACANLAVALYKDGRKQEARQVIERARELAGTPFGSYNLACYLALAGDGQGALEFLGEAVELGFADTMIRSDPDLDLLRTDPAFEAIIEEIEGRIRYRRALSLSVFPPQ